MTDALVVKNPLAPTSFAEAKAFAELMANSSFVPVAFKGKPGDVLAAIQMGAEVGLAPLAALQNIAVINGRPCIWGDAVPAIAMSHPLYESMDESFDDKTMTATCRAKRKGSPEQVQTFSQKDAEAAGLWNKAGTWKQYPKRMLQMRARGFAMRDVFPDALKGLITREEALDYPDVKEINPKSQQTPVLEATKPIVIDSAALDATVTVEIPVQAAAIPPGRESGNTSGSVASSKAAAAPSSATVNWPSCPKCDKQNQYVIRSKIRGTKQYKDPPEFVCWKKPDMNKLGCGHVWSPEKAPMTVSDPPALEKALKALSLVDMRLANADKMLQRVYDSPTMLEYWNACTPEDQQKIATKFEEMMNDAPITETDIPF